MMTLAKRVGFDGGAGDGDAEDLDADGTGVEERN